MDAGDQLENSCEVQTFVQRTNVYYIRPDLQGNMYFNYISTNLFLDFPELCWGCTLLPTYVFPDVLQYIFRIFQAFTTCTVVCTSEVLVSINTIWGDFSCSLASQLSNEPFPPVPNEVRCSTVTILQSHVLPCIQWSIPNAISLVISNFCIRPNLYVLIAILHHVLYVHSHLTPFVF